MIINVFSQVVEDVVLWPEGGLAIKRLNTWNIQRFKKRQVIRVQVFIRGTPRQVFIDS